MRIAKGHIVPLGYGKYCRADSIVGDEPLEEGRGPGKRTRVSIKHLPAPLIVSRSEGAILRDLVEMPKEVTKTRELYDMLSDILDTISDINPLLRSSVLDQGHRDSLPWQCHESHSVLWIARPLHMGLHPQHNERRATCHKHLPHSKRSEPKM